MDGFELLAQRVGVTISPSGALTLAPGSPGNVTLVTVNGTITLQIEDIPKFDLPDAGGSGTVPFYLAGIVMVGVAAVLGALRLRIPRGTRPAPVRASMLQPTLRSEARMIRRG